jgi:hypothetical protein
VSEQSDLGFDFEDLARLAERDPESFEARRTALVQAVIEAAPEHLRPRLEGLQWQIDCVRRQSRSPLGACVRISDLMWQRVLGKGGLVEALQQGASAATPPLEPTANVLPFASGEAEPETE